MRCEIFRAGKQVCGPINYQDPSVKTYLTQCGVPEYRIPRFLTQGLTIDSIIIKPVREHRPMLTASQRYGGYDRVNSTNEVIYQYKVVEMTVEEMRGIQLARLAELHDMYEGRRFNYRGVLIKADMEARTNAHAILDLFKQDPTMVTYWRGVDPETQKPATISVNGLAEMGALYEAIVGYLAAGFAVRSAIEAEINAATRVQMTTYSAKQKFMEALQLTAE